MITYRELINNAKKNIDKVNLEHRAAYEFLMDILNCDRAKLILIENDEVSDDVLDKFADMLSQYIFDYKPIEYVLGYTYFCGNKIYVDENTLIPRSETEDLIYRTLEYIKRYNISCNKILDIGSGSGCIAISLNKIIIIICQKRGFTGSKSLCDYLKSKKVYGRKCNLNRPLRLGEDLDSQRGRPGEAPDEGEDGQGKGERNNVCESHTTQRPGRSHR